MEASLIVVEPRSISFLTSQVFEWHLHYKWVTFQLKGKGPPGKWVPYLIVARRI